jgi:Tol biopolymer transport system component
MKTLPFLILLGGTALAQTTERAQPSVQADADGFLSATSADGRYVAFVSAADNLVVADANSNYDVFVRDRQTGITELVSVSSSGVQGNGSSGYASTSGFVDFFGLAISADGRYVAFMSTASNLTPVDGISWDIFVRDRQSGTTELVSVDSNENPLNTKCVRCAISADGRYVTFETTGANGFDQVVLRDRQMGTTELVSVDPGAALGNNHSYYSALSADGRYVAFLSSASNLVSGDTNAADDVFVRDRQLGTTERVSVDSSGLQANNFSVELAISGDGRFVAFRSAASNLVAGDTNGAFDVFVRDRLTGTTERSSVSSGGVQGNGDSASPAISADGRYVAFESKATNLVTGDTNAHADVFVRDRVTGATERVSVDSSGAQGNGDSGYFHVFSGSQVDVYSLSISGDGRIVAFESGATNLVPGDTNTLADIFAHDRQTGITKRLDLGFGQANSQCNQASISADGRYVAFRSGASNLDPNNMNGGDDIFLFDRTLHEITLVTRNTSGVSPNGSSLNPVVSSDGRYVAYESGASDIVPGDTNNVNDIFVFDRVSSTTALVSVGMSGPANAKSTIPSISADGRYVAFQSDATNLVAGDTNAQPDIFVRDLQAGTTERVSLSSSGAQGDGFNNTPSISADGRYVAFASAATNFAAGDTNGNADIFVRDRQTGVTEVVSVATGGSQPLSGLRPAISANGRCVAFVSFASNLVPGDTNNFLDVFVRDRVSATTERVSVATNGAQGDNTSTLPPAISGDGRFVAFLSYATNLVPFDTNGFPDAFVHDRLTHTTERVSLAFDGSQSNANSDIPSISNDGRFIAFASYASNLVIGDTAAIEDIFVRDRGATSSFVSFCYGDGTGAACPCANTGNAGHGCQNSASTGGALLTAVGGASLSLDTVVFTSSNELPSSTSVVLQGTSAVSPAFFGSGLRCTGGTLKRLYTKNAMAGTMTAPQMGDASVSARSTALGDTILFGTTRIYQVYYRDANLTFCTGGFNVTNAIAIAWGA